VQLVRRLIMCLLQSSTYGVQLVRRLILCLLQSSTGSN